MTAEALQLMTCPFCAEQVSSAAKKCKHCGETIDVALRAAEEARRAAERSSSGQQVFMNAASSATAAVAVTPVAAVGRKSRTTAAAWALLLGGVGAHKFYLGKSMQGLIYLLLCWTFIPAVVALVEGVSYLGMNDEKFLQKYG